MAKIVKELLTKWTYKVDSRQLKATATIIKNLHRSMMQVRKESVGFERGEVQRLRNIQTGWRGVNREVQKYKSNLRGVRGVGTGALAGRSRGVGTGVGTEAFIGRNRGGKGGVGKGRRGGVLGNQSTAFLAGNVLKSPIIGSALLAAGGSPAILAGLAVAGGIGKSIGAAARKQQSEVGLRTFARAEAGGDAEQGRADTTKFMGELDQFAKRTPFGVTQLRELALQMKGFGFATKEVIPTLSQLGDLTGGRVDVLRRMLVNLAQIRNLDKAQTVDLKQIANAGIPIQQKLAKMLGKTRKELAEMIPQGQITAAHIAQAFKEMTEAGGLFFGQMEERSKTLGGQWEKLKENITIVGESMGGPLLGPLTAFLRTVNQFTDSMVALTGAISEGFGRVLNPIGEFIQSIPGFGLFTQVMKSLGLVMASVMTLGVLPFLIALEDIGAFFDGKDSFFGDMMEWMGLREGENITSMIRRNFEELVMDLGFLWDDLISGATFDSVMGSDFVTGLETSLNAVVTAVGDTISSVWDGVLDKLKLVDRWFADTVLGKFIKATIGTPAFDILNQTGRPLSTEGGTAESSVPIQGSRADNRSQNNTFNVNPGGVGEAVNAATDRGILNTNGRQFQSQFAG